MSQGTLLPSSEPAGAPSVREATRTSDGLADNWGRSGTKVTNNGAEPEVPHPWRRRLYRWLKWWVRWVLTIDVIVAFAMFAQQRSLGSVPTVIVAVVLGAIALLTKPRRSSVRRRIVPLLVGIAFVGVVASVTWSYSGYLHAPGAATTAARTANWMRDHHMGSIVDVLEQRLYPGQALGNGPIAANQTPLAALARSVGRSGGAATPRSIPSHDLIDSTVKGEGKWSPSGRLVHGHTVTYTTFVRPDPAHTNVVASAVWFDPRSTKVTYVPGTKQPGNWAWKSGIPVSKRSGLVAAFDSGFKFKDIPGGYRTEGRTPVPLMAGQASLVLRRDKPAEIGAWGSEVTMAPDVTSVRQNLRLIVDQARIVPGLQSGTAHSWGSHKWQVEHTNRSGIGITADHALVYVAGSQLTTKTLASAFVRLGCVRAMELDIHASNPTFNFFYPNANGTSVTGRKLTASMKSSATRYLAPDQRDFYAVTVR